MNSVWHRFGANSTSLVWFETISHKCLIWSTLSLILRSKLLFRTRSLEIKMWEKNLFHLISP